ncbi:MAG TPA: AAA family ATPase [Blastocatellia bacterium]|nr:AAA family ATPase [Blastocatellia bacterium]
MQPRLGVISRKKYYGGMSLMERKKQIAFGEFCLDEESELLLRGAEAIALRPKVFAVLKYLLNHPGQLITKQQLLDAVWPDAYVGDAVLKDSIRQLREALGDEVKSPRFIETAHRRGYRFIGQVKEETCERDQESEALTGARVPQASPWSPQLPAHSSTAVGALGRETALARLRDWLDGALRGDKQIVFVTGEPGIGKTTLVETFLDQAAASHNIWTARGQCLEQFGAGEPYLPVLDALSRLCQEPGRERAIELLRQHAPTWVAQMPWIAASTGSGGLQPNMQGVTRERMLREMAGAVEALTVETPLVLLLEDLHWSDYSTLDLIAYLARWRSPARLMVIGTYRPVDVILREHPLKGVKQELQAHKLCNELPLEYLTESAVAQFLAARLPRHQFPSRLARLIHQRTEGNPLYMVNLVDYLLDERMIVEQNGGWQLQADLGEIELGVPENILHLIEKQIERLAPQEQRVLEAASVVGMNCSVEAITAALDGDALEIEERCEEIARRHQFLSPPQVVVLPDGTITTRFKFNHMLYLDAIYARIAPTRRAEMHRRISKRGEEIYGDRVTEIASELAVHFAQGRDWQRAVKYHLMAAENAARRFANYEAAALARRGLELLKLLPETGERLQQEVSLRLILGASLMAIKGPAAPEVEQVYLAARELCERQGASPQLFKVLYSLRLFYMYRGDTKTAREFAERLTNLAEDLEDAALMVEAHRTLGASLVIVGEFVAALEQFERAIALYEPSRRDSFFSIHGNDAKMMSLCLASWLLWCLGYPDKSLDRIDKALAHAEGLSHTQELIVALHLASRIHQLRRDAKQSRQLVETAIALAKEQGMEIWMALSSIYLGWAQVEQGELEAGIEQMRTGLGTYLATKSKLWRPYFLGLFAEALGKAGQAEEGLTVSEEALAAARDTNETYYEAEIHRIRGELIMIKAGTSAAREAKACFDQAIAIAKQQQAKSWELRASMSLARLYLAEGERAKAQQLLADIYGWFTEGFDTADMRDARALLDSLD